MPEKRIKWKTSITEDTGPYSSVTGHFEGEVYDGVVLDTNVKVDLEFTLTWDEKANFMNELAELVKKYHL